MPRTIVYACLLTALRCQSASPQHPAAPIAASEDLDDGGRLFRRHCASCHGRNGEGGRGPELTRGFQSGESDLDLARVIASGIAGTEMAAYGERLGPGKIAGIVAFLRSARPNEPVAIGDRTRGETLFWKEGGCGNCHAVGARGNRVGPDLSRIGRQRSVANMRESLINPSAYIPPDYASVTVVTNEGKTIRGFERAVDDFSVVLLELSGAIRSFDRQEIRSVISGKESMMPSYAKTLSESDLNDLLAYLAALGTSPVKR